MGRIGITGNMGTVLGLIIGFDKFKSWISARREDTVQKESKHSVRAKRLGNKRGLPSMILLGPILIGTHIAAFIGMALGESKKWTIIWSIVSIGLWAPVFGLLTALGYDVFI